MPKIAAQQFEHRQPRRRLPVRHGVGFQHFAFRRKDCLELIDQARFAGARLAHDRNNLSVTAAHQFGCTLHLGQFAPDEFRQPPPRRKLKVRT
jgi:hypothetical protein